MNFWISACTSSVVCMWPFENDVSRSFAATLVDEAPVAIVMSYIWEMTTVSYWCR